MILWRKYGVTPPTKVKCVVPEQLSQSAHLNYNFSIILFAECGQRVNIIFFAPAAPKG
jgi:hypothetical protein